MIEFLHTVLSFVIAISILVAVHEYGHFWVARRCGVKVIRFSIGFGRPLLTWRDKQDTEYTVAAIPLGGYVKMLGEGEEEDEIPPEMQEQSFASKRVGQRIAIVAAGPVANFVLALVAFWLLNLAGTRGFAPVIGEVMPDSLAAVAGLEAGQEILSVDGRHTPTRQQLSERLLRRLGETGEMHITVKYPDSDYVYGVVVDLDRWQIDVDEPDPVGGLGLKLFWPEPEVPLLAKIFPDSPALEAGLQPGDLVVSLDGQPVAHWDELVAYVVLRPGVSIDVGIRRGEVLLNFPITPKGRKTDSGETVGLIGVAPEIPPWPEHMVRNYHYGPLEGVAAAARRVGDTSWFILDSIRKMVVGEISPKNLSGPITIANVADESIRAGWKVFVTILAYLSLSLGVINLLPIPVLDGGHLLYYLIELAAGKPLPEKVQELGYQVGLFLVFSLMAFAIYNDVMRL